MKFYITCNDWESHYYFIYSVVWTYLWLPHVMGRHYVCMLILEFFDLSENFYMSGRVTMSTLRIPVCLSLDKTNFNSKSYQSIFERFTYLDWTSYEEKILNFDFLKKCRPKRKIKKMNFNSKCYKTIFLNTVYYQCIFFAINTT